MSKQRIKIVADSHLETLGNCGGYYSCPKDSEGKRIGPLVGYAGTYEGSGGKQWQFVGDVYANFAKAEPYANVLDYFAGCLSLKLDERIGLANIDALCAAPIGGYSLCDALGLCNKSLDIAMLKAEKQVTAVKTSTSREKSELVFGRHDVQKGQRCAVVEDVFNNFSTTEKFIKLIESRGGIVVALVGFLNRSISIDTHFAGIPVVSLVRQPIHEWKQNDPEVIEDIAKGNVVWKPKDEWDRLMKAMHAQSA